MSSRPLSFPLIGKIYSTEARSAVADHFKKPLILGAPFDVLANGCLNMPMDWNERYVSKDTPWDKAAAAPPLLDLLKDERRFFAQGTVLVPGCGHGHDALAIALAGSSTIGLDIAPLALEGARRLDQKGQVDYQLKDFLSAHPEDFPKIGAIFEHTCFCAIDPSERAAYRDACSRLLTAGGYWVAIIFLTPREEDDPTIGPPFQSKVKEIEDLFFPTFKLIESYQPTNTFPEREGKELIMIWQKQEPT